MTGAAAASIEAPPRSPVHRLRAWLANPWGRPRFLALVTLGYLVWSIVPILIAIRFSFNEGRSRSQGWSGRAGSRDDLLRIEMPVEDGWTLPAHWYSDESIAALERERIFARTWQYAGRAEQVAEPGCFFASRAGHIPIAVVRGKDGELRAS